LSKAIFATVFAFIVDAEFAVAIFATIFAAVFATFRNGDRALILRHDCKCEEAEQNR
jgi:hypothetical protein